MNESVSQENLQELAQLNQRLKLLESKVQVARSLARVCDDLIREFNRNPLRPDLGLLVTEADHALACWNQLNPGPKPS